MRERLFAILLSLLLAAAPASAEPEAMRGAKPGEFDLYVLALSWSPGFCALGGERRGATQCEPGQGPGFVLHGLWPQFERGYPVFCPTRMRGPVARDLDAVNGLMPTRTLARAQWRKHGTCSGLDPASYFAEAARAARLVIPPEAFETIEEPRQVSPDAVEAAFAEANAGLRPDMMTVACGRAKEGDVVLREVRVCLTRDLAGFRPCPAEVEADRCMASRLVIPPER